MGIIDTIIKKIKKALGREVDRKVDSAINRTVGNAINKNNNNYSGGSQNDYNGSFYGNNAQTPRSKPTDVRATLSAMMLTYQQAGYTVLSNQPITIIAGVKPAYPVRNFDYVVSKGNVIYGVIMITNHNKDRNRAYMIPKSTCAENGIPFINFYTHFPNEPQYVQQRLMSQIPLNV